MKKIIDIKRLYDDYNIPYASSGNPHCTQGWVNTHCPFCEGRKDFHLGYNLSEGFFVCWRCGFKPLYLALEKILHLPEDEVQAIVHKYRWSEDESSSSEFKPVIKATEIKHPSSTKKLNENHKKYLVARGYDPEELERDWLLQGTGPMSLLNGDNGVEINYSYRVLAPIYWEGREVSFQARDITGKADLRYIACPKSKEIIHHKNVLYRAPFPWHTKNAIIVEGIADAWRFGKIAVATFGVKYTYAQLKAIANLFEKVGIAYDNDEPGQVQGDKLAKELSFMGVKTCKIVLNGVNDPSELTVRIASDIANDVLHW